MRWNGFLGNGFEEAFKTISTMETLRVLDLSWNLLGSGKLSNIKSTCINDCCEMIKNNKSIYHLDLAGNSFDFDESKQIAKILNKHNHTIYGFHFEGNKGYTDELGFLHVNEDVDLYEEVHLRRKING